MTAHPGVMLQELHSLETEGCSKSEGYSKSEMEQDIISFNFRFSGPELSICQRIWSRSGDIFCLKHCRIYSSYKKEGRNYQNHIYLATGLFPRLCRSSYPGKKYFLLSTGSNLKKWISKGQKREKSENAGWGKSSWGRHAQVNFMWSLWDQLCQVSNIFIKWIYLQTSNFHDILISRWTTKYKN